MAPHVASMSDDSRITENSLSRTLNMACPPSSVSSVALAGAGMNSFRYIYLACSGATSEEQALLHLINATSDLPCSTPGCLLVIHVSAFTTQIDQTFTLFPCTGRAVQQQHPEPLDVTSV